MRAVARNFQGLRPMDPAGGSGMKSKLVKFRIRAEEKEALSEAADRAGVTATVRWRGSTKIAFKASSSTRWRTGLVLRSIR